MSHVVGYLDARITLGDLEMWIVGHLQEVLDSKEEEAIRYVNEIDADLISFAEGLIAEGELRSRLERYMREYETCHLAPPEEMSPRPERLQLDTSAQTVTTRVEDIDPMVTHHFEVQAV
jgi:hypothetical protein